MLIDNVKKSVVNAGFHDGEKMPSVRKMADRLNLSVNTIHKVYRLLAEEGRIQLVHGKGCFWGEAPVMEVTPEESVYSVVERLFQNDLDSGFLNAFDELPSCKELSNRYNVSPYIVKKFLMQKCSQGILRHVGHRFFFSEGRRIEKLNYVLFVHRSDEFGRLKIESERESDVFRTFAQIAAEQKIAVKFIGYHEPSTYRRVKNLSSRTMLIVLACSYRRGLSMTPRNCLLIFLRSRIRFRSGGNMRRIWCQ